MDTHGRAGKNPKRNQKGSQMRWVVKDQSLQMLRQVKMNSIQLEEDRPIGSRGFEKQNSVCRPMCYQEMSEIHDPMTKEKDQKFGEIDNPCTTESSDATQPREEVKAKEELGEVDKIPTRVIERKKGKKEKEKGKKEKEKEKPKEKPKEKTKKKPKKTKKTKPDKEEWFMDTRNQDLLRILLDPNRTWEKMVVAVLHMVRCREFTEYNKKLQCPLPTRFCAYNIAFFDLDKESKDMPWPPIHQIPPPLRDSLDDSVNIIAIKIAKSDIKYPISIYGTVLARDEYDFRCIYLFKRGRDDPQLITSKDNMLTLISPIRAPAVRDSMFFEFDLKIIGSGDVDEDFSKGFIEHSAIRHAKKPTIKLLYSCLSTMELVYTPVPFALQASVAVSVLHGPSDFTSKVTAWTTQNGENKIILYDSVVAGTQPKLRPGRSICSIVAVPLNEDLVLRVYFLDEGQGGPAECFEVTVGYEVNGVVHEVVERALEKGPYKLLVKVSWKGVKNWRGNSSWGRPNMWGHLGGRRVLL